MVSLTTSVEDETIPKSKDSVGLKALFATVLVFALALLCCLFHNFCESEKIGIFFADSRNYLMTANNFSTMFIDAIRGKTPDQLMSDVTVCERIKIDGPVMASFFGLISLITGHAIQADDWKIIVVANSLFHACTAAIVVLIMARIVPNLRYAIFAGIAYAVYPPALITAGRLITESITNFLIVAFLFSLLLCMKRPALGVLVGFLSGVSLLHRVLIALPVVACILIAACQKNLKLKALVLIVVAAFMTILPWTLFSAHYLGRPMITTERFANHNAFIGWDVENDAFQNTAPLPKQRMLAQYQPVEVILGLVMSSPGECARLLVKKVSRMYGMPFNDFRARCLGISDEAIIYLHWLYIFIAVIGIFHLVLGGFSLLGVESRVIAVLALAYLSLMQSIFLFEGNSRYGFTTLPLLVVFGAVGVYFLQEKLRQANKGKTLLVTAAACVCAIFIVSSERMLGGLQEDSPVLLRSGQTASCALFLDKRFENWLRKQQIALLLVDGDVGLEQALLSVNGKMLDSKFIPLNYLDSKKYRNFNLMGEAANLLGCKLDDLRQWRAAIVPVSALRPEAENTFEITAQSKAAAIYLDDDQKSRRYRSLSAISMNRLLNTATGFEMRPFSPILSGLVKKTFSAAGQTNHQNLKIYLGFVSPCYGDSISPKSLASGFLRNLRQDEFPVLTRVAGSDEIAVNKFVVAHSLTGMSVMVPAFAGCSHIRVTLKGQVRSADAHGAAGIAIATSEANDMPWRLANLPASIPAGKEWSDFVIADIVPQNIYNHSISQVSVAFYPGPWPLVSGVGPSLSGRPVFFRKLELRVEPVSLVDLCGRNLFLY